MITLTEAAAKQILRSATETEADEMYLRIAAKKEADGTIEYGMGFDDIDEGDMLVKSSDVRVIIAPSAQLLLKDTVIDYVELEPDQFHFIFKNPNDPRHKQADS
jgi:iron-sulfur cluster assembly protein